MNLRRGAGLRSRHGAQGEAGHAGLFDAGDPAGRRPSHGRLLERIPGGFAERMVLAAPLLLEVPNGLSRITPRSPNRSRSASTRSRRRALQDNDAPLVVGCGPGRPPRPHRRLRLKGIHPITSPRISRPKRRELAARMGADIVIDPKVESPYARLAGQARRDLRMRRRPGAAAAGLRSRASRLHAGSSPASAWSPTGSNRCSES